MKVIGGEQVIEFENILDLGHAMIEKGQNRLFYSLGRAALAAILENEISHGNNSILLPDYLCESITNNVISLGMAYSFYHIKSDLQPDLDSINRQINKKQIIFCPVHWPFVSSEISRENELYHKELSLVCGQRYTPEDMHRILEVLNRASAMYK